MSTFISGGTPECAKVVPTPFRKLCRQSLSCHNPRPSSHKGCITVVAGHGPKRLALIATQREVEGFRRNYIRCHDFLAVEPQNGGRRSWGCLSTSCSVSPSAELEKLRNVWISRTRRDGDISPLTDSKSTKAIVDGLECLISQFDHGKSTPLPHHLSSE